MSQINASHLFMLFALLLSAISVSCTPLGEGSGRLCAGAIQGCPELDFIEIEGGSFQMGSELFNQQEMPVHEVEVASFQLMKAEVTVGQFRGCVETGFCEAPEQEQGCTWTEEPQEREQLPMNCISWHQAMAFAEWMNARLPTEAEWEYAARSGGRDQSYPWGGTEASCRYANLYDCHEGLTEACEDPRGDSEQGLCDQIGNLWEWVQDAWHPNYEGAPSDGSGWCDERCPEFAGDEGYFLNDPTPRVLRGGSWTNQSWRVNAMTRSQFTPSYGSVFYGLRLARSLPAEGE